MKRLKLFAVLCLLSTSVFAQEEWGQKFEQLGEKLPTPNTYRAGSGAPGENYWQQKADYKIDVSIDDETQILTGSETITYYNNSPDPLEYLWVQLDQNVRAKGNLSQVTGNTSMRDSLPAKFFEGSIVDNDYEGGYDIKAVKDESGKPLPHTINRTMMRIDLPAVLKNGESFTFSIDWSYNIYDRMTVGGRGGFEYFPEDDNYAYTCAQWFPRMAVYDDYEGWQNKQFIGRGEFALTFGDYEVNITVPADHIVAATGELQNAKQVLSKDQFKRFEKAKSTYDAPVFIVTEEEAIENEKSRSKKTATWQFKAERVRDFAFASSRKYIWDAQAVKLPNGNTPLAMSLYPKEGNPLWADESTKAVKNTLEVYSERTFDYPYPVAISVHAANQGMEYPMICFNYGRPTPEGEVSERLRDGMISVIVHEVGHNYFPMIVNSDERQWTWMDEGLNSFLERETKRVRYDDLDLTWGSPQGVTRYMKMEKSQIRPIMTNSEQVKQFGYNAYGKPSAALTVLRETVMGPDLFDAAFKEYANRWMFKHPKPADFFRTMEDASAVDLDWFWRGWFYSVDHVDISLDEVKWFKMRDEKVDVENKGKKGEIASASSSEGEQMMDFGDSPEPFSLIETDDRYYGEFMNRVDDKAIMSKFAGKNFYQLKFSNKGGLVMPIIIEFTFEDGTKETQTIPAEIWRYNEQEVTKVFSFEKQVTNIVVDPNNDTADTNTEDNMFPRKAEASKFDAFKKDMDAKVDAVGTWAYTAETPQGNTTGTVTIDKKKNDYSGTMVGANGTYELQEVTVKGNVLSFKFRVDAGGGIDITSEVIIQEDEFNGEMKLGSYGTYPIRASRQ
ncbi:M1 family metallopeptidase [Fulvivirga aurantia]|uniref:M1 family metallopeptidase n=1 Tax=Fulvivirga aurantia TaxID=2529383 RepID=UPI001623B33E|nr:M1 family metallopeptidase [Fulvivirga aurantia]